MPHDYGAAGTSNAGRHEWRPYSRHPLVLRRGYGVRLARVMLHELRWRQEPRQWVLRSIAGTLVVLLHLAALTMMLLVRPAGYGSPSGTAGSSAVSVRLINQSVPAPTPAPPPIALPQRKIARASHPAVPAQHAPATPLPPVTLQGRPPRVTVTPTRPRIAVVRPVVTPAPAQVKPSAVAVPPITLPPPARVVEEPSNQPLLVPKAQAIKVAPVTPLAPSPPPVPVAQAAPAITLAKPALHVNVPAAAPAAPLAPAQVQATPLPVPQVTVVPPMVQVTPVPTVAPSITVAGQAPQVVKPLPIPTVAATPTTEHPAANVPVPAAPSTSSTVHVAQAGAAASTRRHTPAAHKAVPRTMAPVSASSSWALANDQFKPVAGHAASPDTFAPHQTAGTGGVRRVPRGNSDVMTRGTDQLGYKPTIFEQYWAPQNESILDTFLRHFIEKLSVAHTFHLAPGVRVRCVLGPVAIFLVCRGADGPRPAPAKTNDPRLDMAPARSLVPGVAVPAPARPATVSAAPFDHVVACEGAKVAGKPPPPGCPGAGLLPAPAHSG